ncbi:YhdH/YhfP family quinone oxidoreductase [Leuconostoc mesenteroides]|uniref:YhdH/YhfP family quinone oxidoreductase n=1 Tax=Leuconostoc mesenteroides TaxID=1245 RepID=UPI002362926F|nr:YhdH/YhfP family quinone oxidoreductase [Leuconostoc mesenteroides]
MKNFKALLVSDKDGEIDYNIENNLTVDDLSNGEVLIKIHYSSVNYKDMLAVQKNGNVIYAKIPAEWIIPIPENISMKEAMILGTAGLTAALSIDALEKNGMRADSYQKILVTGATGGVGSIALQILSKVGYKNIIALVRKENQIEVAKTLGATDTILLSDFEFENKPLNKQQFHYILDTVGGELVANLIPYVFYQGSISLCGNAGGIKMATTVLPFILRGINLLGIDSVNISNEKRLFIWENLSKKWKITDTTLVNEITLEDLSKTLNQLKEGKHLGRTIVNI